VNRPARAVGPSIPPVGVSQPTVRRPAVRLTAGRVSTRRSLLLGAASLGAAACSRSEVTSSDAPSVGRLRTPQALTYWKSLSGPRHDAQVRLVDAFNATQDQARVTLEHQGEYDALADKLRVALASGAPPDVAMLGTNADLPFFARLGVLQPLDDLARADKSFRLEELSPGFLRDSRVASHASGASPAASRAEGTLFQLPFARSTPLLYANLNLLEAHGLPHTPDALPASWTGFLDTARLLRARRITAQDGEAAPPAGPFAHGVGTSWWEFQSMLWSFGGAFSEGPRHVRIDSPASIDAVHYLADLVHRHRVTLATKNARGAFMSGEIALLITSSANLTQIEDAAPFTVGVAAVPRSRERGVPGGGAGLSLLHAIPRRAKEHGWRFLTFMTSAESTVAFAQATGYAPVRPAAQAEPLLAALLERSPNTRTALAQVDRVRPVDAVLAAPFANRHIQAALDAVLFRGANVPDVCAQLAAQLRRAAEAT